MVYANTYKDIRAPTQFLSLIKMVWLFLSFVWTCVKQHKMYERQKFIIPYSFHLAALNMLKNIYLAFRNTVKYLSFVHCQRTLNWLHSTWWNFKIISVRFQFFKVAKIIYTIPSQMHAQSYSCSIWPYKQILGCMQDSWGKSWKWCFFYIDLWI